MRLFSHSDMRWLAVLRSALGPRLDSAGQGIGSFLALSSEPAAFLGVLDSVDLVASELCRGLVAFETVEGSVVESEAALDDRGLVSSQVSHASFSLDVTEGSFDGDVECFDAFPDAAFLGAGVACCDRTPCSDQNDGSANAGVDEKDMVADLACLRVGEGRLVSVEALLVVEPREEGRSEVLLLCFFADRKVCVEFW